MAVKTKTKPSMSPTVQPVDPDITVNEEMITPDMAMQYLERNYKTNRNIRPKTVRRYVADMLHGNWQYGASDPIRFNKDGELIDGQHRLSAVVQAGVPIRALIVRGVPNEAIHAIDTGRSRSPSDALRISGHTNTVLLAASTRMLLTIKQGTLSAKSSIWFSHSDIIEAVERHPVLPDWCSRIRPVRGIRPSQITAMCYIGDQLLSKPETADAFLRVFNTGIPAYEGCPAHKLRESLMQASERKSRKTSEMWSMMMIAHVWNLFAKQKTLQVLKSPNQVTIEGLDRKKI